MTMKDTSYMIAGKCLSVCITKEAHDWITSEAVARGISGSAFVTSILSSAMSEYIGLTIEEALDTVANQYGVPRRAIARIAICAAMDDRFGRGLMATHALAQQRA